MKHPSGSSKGWIALAFVALAGAAATIPLHEAARERVGRGAAVVESEVPVFVLPSASVVRRLSLQYRPAAADLFFLRLVHYVGTQAADDAGWPQLFDLGALVTDIDPRFGYAYEATGVLLNSKGRIDESIEILDRGQRNVPGRWQLPFFNAFNYWYERGDTARGAELVFEAARLPGSPAYLSEFAGRLLDHRGRLEDSLGYIDALLAATTDQTMRERWTARRNEVLAEIDLRAIEAAARAFEEREGFVPPTLADLVRLRYLLELPTGPDGAQYGWDATKREASWSGMESRIRFNHAATKAGGSRIEVTPR